MVSMRAWMSVTMRRLAAAWGPSPVASSVAKADWAVVSWVWRSVGVGFGKGRGLVQSDASVALEGESQRWDAVFIGDEISACFADKLGTAGDVIEVLAGKGKDEPGFGAESGEHGGGSCAGARVLPDRFPAQLVHLDAVGDLRIDGVNDTLSGKLCCGRGRRRHGNELRMQYADNQGEDSESDEGEFHRFKNQWMIQFAPSLMTRTLLLPPPITVV